MNETTNSLLDEAIDELNRYVPDEHERRPYDFHAHRRRHLLATLGWAAAGFATIALLSLALPALTEPLRSELALRTAGLCVGVAFVGFGCVAWIASRTRPHERRAAHVLLWTTVVVYAVIVNVFAASLGLVTADLAVSPRLAVSGAVAATGGGVVVVLGSAVALGFDAPWKDTVRWLGLVALGTAAVAAARPDLWWVGVIVGVILARAVATTLRHSLVGPGAPPPALAACLVAGFTGLALLAVYVVVRDVIRLTIEITGASIHQATRQ